MMDFFEELWWVLEASQTHILWLFNRSSFCLLWIDNKCKQDTLWLSSSSFFLIYDFSRATTHHLLLACFFRRGSAGGWHHCVLLAAAHHHQWKWYNHSFTYYLYQVHSMTFGEDEFTKKSLVFCAWTPPPQHKVMMHAPAITTLALAIHDPPSFSSRGSLMMLESCTALRLVFPTWQVT